MTRGRGGSGAEVSEFLRKQSTSYVLPKIISLAYLSLPLLKGHWN